MDICPHINSINIDAVKKKLPNKLQNFNFPHGTCEKCMMMTVYQPNQRKKKSKGKGKKGKANQVKEVSSSTDELELCLSCMALNCSKETSLAHSQIHYKDNSKHPIVLNVNSLELYCFTCEFSLTKLREMIDEGKETEQIDNIINTVAIFISSKKDKNNSVADLEESKAQNNSSENSKSESLQEKKSESKDDITETDEQKEARELNLAIFQSQVDSYQADIDQTEEKELYCIRGLHNLGNTCFFNSVLQCLNATKDLYFMLKDKNNGCYGAGYPFHNQMRKFMGVMRTKSHQSHSPTGVLNAICRKYPRFHGGGQHDAHELLITLLDCMDTEAVK